jgi:hypothetical protein
MEEMKTYVISLPHIKIDESDFVVVSVVLGIKPRDSGMVGKSSTTVKPQP